MSSILKHFQNKAFVPEDPNQLLVFNLAKRLGDLRSLKQYLQIAAEASADQILAVAARSMKGDTASWGANFREAFRGNTDA